MRALHSVNSNNFLCKIFLIYSVLSRYVIHGDILNDTINETSDKQAIAAAANSENNSIIENILIIFGISFGYLKIKFFRNNFIFSLFKLFVYFYLDCYCFLGRWFVFLWNIIKLKVWFWSLLTGRLSSVVEHSTADREVSGSNPLASWFF